MGRTLNSIMMKNVYVTASDRHSSCKRLIDIIHQLATDCV